MRGVEGEVSAVAGFSLEAGHPLRHGDVDDGVTLETAIGIDGLAVGDRDIELMDPIDRTAAQNSEGFRPDGVLGSGTLVE